MLRISSCPQQHPSYRAWYRGPSSWYQPMPSQDPSRGLYWSDLQSERLEIQPVGDIEIGGYRLWIVVYDHSIHACILQSHNTVHATIIELDTLSYTDRSATDDYHALLALIACGFA